MSDAGVFELPKGGNGRGQVFSDGISAHLGGKTGLSDVVIDQAAVDDAGQPAHADRKDLGPLVAMPLQSGLDYFWENGTPLIPAVTPTRSLQAIAKRLFDVILASLALLVILPLLLMVAVLIKLTSPGPVLFRQSRTGENGVPFDIFKFRSMRIEDCDHSGVQQTRHGDHRTTAIGRFIRAKSIDELPQLLNVLIGNMSLVGPRPHVPGMLAAGQLYEELVPYYALRHKAKPGITGWAQANGFRGPTDDPRLARARIDHDLAYIQNFSLYLDLVTLLKTVWRELHRGTGV